MFYVVAGTILAMAPMLNAGAFSFLKTKTQEGLISILILLLGWVVGKYVVPWFKTDTRRKVAESLLLVAEDLVNWYSMKYPDKPYLVWIEEAIKKIKEKFNVSEETAERVIMSKIKQNGLK